MAHRWLRASVLVVCFAAAATAGYWVSDRLGAEALRREAQDQLSTLMQGSVRIARARLVVRGGLFLEGDRVGVYPSEQAPHRPALFASTVSAELDALALLVGRFRLTGLRIDDAVLEIRRMPGGRWTPGPFQALADRDRSVPSADMERSLDLVHAFEAVTRTLLESPLIARRVEIRRSRITFVDSAQGGRDGPVELSLYQVNGRLVHQWLSGDANLRLEASLVDKHRRTFSLRAVGWQRGGDTMRLAATTAGLPLETVEPYLVPEDGSTRLDGTLNGELAYETRAAQHGTVTLRADVESLLTTVDVRGGHYEIARPTVGLEAALEIHPGRIRLAEGLIDAAGISLTVGGAIDRPMGPAARARLEVDVDGLELEEVREIVRSLPDADSETLESVLERIEEGRVDRIGVRGTARLDDWGRLWVGEAERVPRGFVLSATVSEVRARASQRDWLSGVGGRIALSGDRIELNEATGYWNDEPLPKIAFEVDGVSRLFGSPGAETDTTTDAEALPGLAPLWQITRGDAGQADGDDVPTRIALHVSRLEHPILRWPITNARILVDDTADGARLVFEGGRWAGAPFDGEARWIAQPVESLVVRLKVHPEQDPDEGEASGPAPSGTGSWATGRFEVGPIADGPLPWRAARGRFDLKGTRLALREVRADLTPRGALAADVTVDLGDAQAVDMGLAFDITNGDVDRLGQGIGFPAGYANGRVRLTGRLDGPLRPQTPLLTSLAGEVAMAAREGEIRRDELPLVLALAQASAGYNEWAERDAITYDTVDAQFAIADGHVTTQDFELDGPLRIYGSGSVDAVHEPYEIVAVIGLFLFRSAGNIMATIPLVKAILPGSEKGLMGAYFQVSGPFENPTVRALPGKSLVEDLPDVLAAPYHLLRAILSGGAPEEGRTGPEPRDENRR